MNENPRHDPDHEIARLEIWLACILLAMAACVAPSPSAPATVASPAQHQEIAVDTVDTVHPGSPRIDDSAPLSVEPG